MAGGVAGTLRGTSIRSVARLGEINDCSPMTFHANRRPGRGGRYRARPRSGMRWHFTGDDSEINISSPGRVHDPEFIA